MQQISIADFSQVFSFLHEEKPIDAWAFSVGSHGIPHPVLDALLLESQGWTGWGFNSNKSWLLFERQEDAILAKLKFGDVTNVD